MRRRRRQAVGARAGAALACLAAAVGVPGCAGGSHRQAVRPAAPARGDATPQAATYGGPARLLVYFKRAVGADPLASQLIVDTDGSASALITLGGPSGEKKHIFRMDPARLRKLRDLVAHTRMHDTWCCNANYYIYWVSMGGRSFRLQQRRVPQSMRPLIHELDSITDAHTGF